MDRGGVLRLLGKKSEITKWTKFRHTVRKVFQNCLGIRSYISGGRSWARFKQRTPPVRVDLLVYRPVDAAPQNSSVSLVVAVVLPAPPPPPPVGCGIVGIIMAADGIAIIAPPPAGACVAMDMVAVVAGGAEGDGDTSETDGV